MMEISEDTAAPDGAGTGQAQRPATEEALAMALATVGKITEALGGFAEVIGANIREAQAPDHWDSRIAALEQRLEARILEALEARWPAAAPPAEPQAAELQAPDPQTAYLQAPAAVEPGEARRRLAIFTAEKAGFERLLIGFRIVLGQLAQQAAAQAVPQPVPQPLPQPAAAPDLTPVIERLDQIGSALARQAEAPAPAAPPAMDALAPFRPEQHALQRQSVAMRLLLRQIGVHSEALRQATGRLGERVQALEAQPAVPAGGAAIDLTPVLARLDAIERQLAARPPSPEGEGTGLAEVSDETIRARLVDGTAARQGARLMVGLQLMSSTVSAELGEMRGVLDRLAAGLDAMRTGAEASPAPAPDPALPDARGSLERSLAVFQMLMRRLGEGVDRLDRAAAAAEAHGARAADEPAAPPATLEAIQRALGGIAARLDSLPPEAPEPGALIEALRERHDDMRARGGAAGDRVQRLAEAFLRAVSQTEAICLELAETARGIRAARDARPDGAEAVQALETAAQAMTSQTAEFLAIAAAVSREVASFSRNAGEAAAG